MGLFVSLSNLVNIALLGGIRVYGRNGVGQTPSSLKCRLLLAYLSVPAGVRRTRAHLAEVLWPDRSAEQSSNSLRNTLSELRKAVGPNVVMDEFGEISLQEKYLRIDLEALNDAADNPSFTMDEFLAGYDHDQDAFALWLESNRSQLRERCAEYALSQAERFQSNGDHRAAKALLVQAISVEPYC